jgi:hypothetical protein
MGFPDRIERTLQVAHPPEKVWAALTTAEGLGAWLGNDATIELRPGGSARMRWTDGHAVAMRVERVEEPTGAGTRLTVVEAGFAQLPEDTHREVYDSHTEGWPRELAELVDYLDAA